MSALEQLEKMLSEGRISRRQFLTQMSVLGLTAAISPAILSTPARAATPKKGGRLRIGVNDFGNHDNLDPALNETQWTQLLNYQIRNCLVEIGPGGAFVPELAESWEATPDAKKWTFHLRKGVEFHNGKTMDADDVAYSVGLHTGEATRSVAHGFLKGLKGIQPDGKNKIHFTLESGDVDFPGIMALFAILIVPKGTKDFEAGMGTGPFILDSFTPGVRSLVKRNPNYWKAGRGHFDEVEMLGISDVVARTNAIVTGEIDAMNYADVKTAHLLEKKPDIQLIRTAGKMHYEFVMNTTLAPFDNNHVRMALKLAIDREDFLKRICHGYGNLGNDHSLCPAYRYYADLPQRTYDPDKARWHMKQSGIGDHTFTIHAAELPFNGAIDGSQLYGEYAAKAGIKIKTVREPSDGFWTNVWRKKPFITSRWSGRPTEDTMLSLAYGSESTWNESYLNNARLDELLKMARTEFDKKKRHQLYTECQQIIRDEGGTVVPVFADFVDVATKKLKFGERASDWPLDGNRCSERWWYDS
ncbi:MAG: ABC transporter substrate-binding protein [Thermodesulfobacteriota bacterium]